MNMLNKIHEKVDDPSLLLKNIFYFLEWANISTIFAGAFSNIPGFMERYKILIFINVIVTLLLDMTLIFLSVRKELIDYLKSF